MNEQSRWAFILGSFFGLSGVIAGALGAHALEKVLEPELLSAFETGVRFQMYHALLLVLLGILAKLFPDKLLKMVIVCIIIGVVLFSGSIYLLTTTSLKVGIITPIGGTVLIIGWLLILVWALRSF